MASIRTAIALALVLISLGSQLATRPSGQQPKRRALLVGRCCVGARLRSARGAGRVVLTAGDAPGVWGWGCR
jgi:hypothetical protein